jgi:hypothetical protein
MEALGAVVVTLLVIVLVNQWGIRRDLGLLRARLDKGAALTESERMQAEESI